MTRFLVVGAICCGFFFGCQPELPTPKPAQTDATRVWRVSASDLNHSYLTYSTRWTGQRVQVDLGDDRYSLDGTAILWHSGRKTDPPCVVFVGAEIPPLRPYGIQVVGTVYGPVEDGQVRRTGATWYVRIQACTADPLP